jgi:hypothetical protein
MDLAEATNQPIEILLGGEPFLARALKLSEWGELQAWYKRAVPSPLERVARAIAAAKDRGEPIPAPVAELLADQAIAASAVWPPRIGTVEWLRGIDGVEGGVAEFFWHSLRRDNPGLARDDATRLAASASPDEVAALESVVLLGKLPAPKSAGPAAPSRPGPTPSGTTGGA